MVQNAEHCKVFPIGGKVVCKYNLFDDCTITEMLHFSFDVPAVAVCGILFLFQGVKIKRRKITTSIKNLNKE